MVSSRPLKESLQSGTSQEAGEQFEASDFGPLLPRRLQAEAREVQKSHFAAVLPKHGLMDTPVN